MVETNIIEADCMSTATNEVPAYELVYGRLSRFSARALLPWMLLSFVSIMAFGSPNAIVTPLIWALLICIWCYPIVMVAGHATAWVLRVYGQFDRANLLMSIPGTLGAFLFAMLVVPLIVMPIFSDGYFGLMASCLVSMWIAHWTISRLRR